MNTEPRAWITLDNKTHPVEWVWIPELKSDWTRNGCLFVKDHHTVNVWVECAYGVGELRHKDIAEYKITKARELAREVKYSRPGKEKRVPQQ